MTAVTTAGLLAGLFGSAFVPAARAAVGDATQVSTTSATAVTALASTFDQGAGTSANPYGESSGTLASAGAVFDIVAKTVGGVAIGTAQNLTYTASAGLLVSADDIACTANTALTAHPVPTTSSVTVATSDAGLACVAVKSNNVTYKAQTGTITITHGTSGTIGTIYVWAIGDVASITLAVAGGRSGNVIANNGIIQNYVSITSKDASGNRIHVPLAAADYTLTTGSADLANGAAVGTVTATGLTANRLNLTAGVCAAGAASGSTVVAQVTHTSSALKSNELTLTCTTAGVRVVGIELQDATGSVVTSGPYQTLELYANYVDASGRSVGDGGALIPINTMGDDAAFGTNELADNDERIDGTKFRHSPIEVNDSGATRTGAAAMSALMDDDTAADYGQVLLGDYTPSSNFFGKNTMQVVVSVVDLSATTASSATFTVSYTTVDFASGGSSVTVGIVAGAKLKKATITLSAAAGKLVTVTIEKVSTGRTFTYYRKANASGVATFIIRRSGTWEVFASYGDDVTDTVKLKR